MSYSTIHMIDWMGLIWGIQGWFNIRKPANVILQVRLKKENYGGISTDVGKACDKVQYLCPIETPRQLRHPDNGPLRRPWYLQVKSGCAFPSGPWRPGLCSSSLLAAHFFWVPSPPPGSSANVTSWPKPSRAAPAGPGPPPCVPSLLSTAPSVVTLCSSPRVPHTVRSMWRSALPWGHRLAPDTPDSWVGYSFASGILSSLRRLSIGEAKWDRKYVSCHSECLSLILQFFRSPAAFRWYLMSC